MRRDGDTTNGNNQRYIVYDIYIEVKCELLR
jgi:hypothetical protein